MKKLLKLCLILLLFPILVLAESITIKNIEVIDKSEGLEVDNPLVEGLNININPKFENVGDFVKYKITLKNNEDKKLEAKLVNKNNAYLSYEISDLKEIDKNKEAEVTLLVKYNTEIDDNSYISSDELGIAFEVPEEVIPTPEVPDTLDATVKIAFAVLAFSLTAYGIVIIAYNKKVKYTIPLGIGIIAMGSLFFIGSSYASTALSIKINTFIEPSNYLYNIVKKQNLGSSELINYNVSSQYAEGHPDEITTGNKAGVYQSNEDPSVYFFRGDKYVLNNDVIFGGFCWKMVRTTSTGGVKLIYHGTPVPTDIECRDNDGSIGSYQFNEHVDYENYDNVEYTYKVGNVETDSIIKSYIDNWYKNNLSAYSKYIEDTPYCNDTTTLSSHDVWQKAYSINARASHFTPEVNPSLHCSKEDSYTVSDEIGNGKLKYPVGLITLDELTLAGATSVTNPNGSSKFDGSGKQTNGSFYLNGYASYWTMTPVGHLSKNAGNVGTIGASGFLHHNDITETRSVRPVITLSKKAKVIAGNGNIGQPFIIETN